MKFLQIQLMTCAVLVFSIFLTPVPALAQSKNLCVLPRTSTIYATDILACLRTGQTVEIDGAEINGDLDLTSLQTDIQTNVIVEPRFTISNSHFTGSLNGMNWDHEVKVIFKEPVSFSGSRFDGTVNFSNTYFEKFVDFSGVQFGDSADFVQTAFVQGVYFTNADFKNITSFHNASFSGGADFSEARIEKNVDFTRSHFTEGADIWFIETQFLGNSFFHEAVFDDQVLFTNGEFLAAVEFERANFKKALSFKDAKFQGTDPQDLVLLKDATFVTIDMTGAQFEDGHLEISGGEYELIMPNFHPRILAPKNDLKVYSFLENNFREQKQLDIVNEIAYWQYLLQRKQRSTLAQALEIIFLDWTFGYGLKPLRSIITSIILILFFAIIYYPKDTLRLVPLAPSKPREQKFSIRLTEIPIAHDNDAPDTLERNHPIKQLPPQFMQAWQAISFSFGVFTKISSGKYIAVRAKSMVIAEWLIGLLMITGLLFSLANTNPLIRSLLGTIF